MDSNRFLSRLPRPKPDTIAAQARTSHVPATTAIVPAVQVSTTYVRDEDNGYSAGSVYGRTDNSSVQHAQSVIAELEAGAEALLFGSGMSAATTVLQSLEHPAHIVACAGVYHGFKEWLSDIGCCQHAVSFVDTSDVAAVARAIRAGDTKLVWIETPSNPMWTISDIRGICDIAHAAGATVCVDSTVATPIFTQPLLLGADIVMHSATKYLNGHSDVVAGALVSATQSALWMRIKKTRSMNGTTLGPFEAFLLTRGMRTLAVRVVRQAQTAAYLAQMLVDHPAVGAVLYPGLASHPGHEVARRQMKGGYGGMLSIRLRHGEKAAIAVAARVKLWRRATSLGGVESLIEHRASIEGPGTSCPTELLRLSVGLEDGDDLLEDLLQALQAAIHPPADIRVVSGTSR